MWSGPVCLAAFIACNVMQAFRHGYGLTAGHPQPQAVDTVHGGNGFWARPSQIIARGTA
jgi:hypothetical protein